MNDDFDLSKLKKTGKKRKNSKAKGNTFERKVCDLLNTVFQTTEFCRSPGSGAFATTHSLPDYLKVYGDIITPKGFRYIIECKKGYNKEGICNVFNPNSILIEMIAQADRDAKKSSKKYLLVIAQDRKDPIAITNYLPGGSIFSDEDTYKDIVKFKYNNQFIWMVKLDELLSSPKSAFFE